MKLTIPKCETCGDARCYRCSSCGHRTCMECSHITEDGCIHKFYTLAASKGWIEENTI